MPMPSLFRYFVVVGSALLGLLLLVHHIAGPAPAPTAQTEPVAKRVVQHDPRASLIERLRDEEAARQAAERGEPVAAPKPALVEATPVPPPVEPVRAEAPQMVLPASLQVAPANEPVPSVFVAKAEKLKAAQARRARIARARARARRHEEAASRQQDQFFYRNSRPTYAQGPSFDPFGFAHPR